MDDKATIAMVDPDAIDIGRYITPIINATTRRGGTFSKDCSIDAHFWNPRKIRHPAAISQNLDGIRKYAADWFVG